MNSLSTTMRWLMSLGKLASLKLSMESVKKSIQQSPEPTLDSPLNASVNVPLVRIRHETKRLGQGTSWTVLGFPRPPFGGPPAAHHIGGMPQLFSLCRGPNRKLEEKREA